MVSTDFVVIIPGILYEKLAWTPLTTGDFTNGAKILHMPTDLLSNILTLQLIRKKYKYKYIVPAIYKMYVRVLDRVPTDHEQPRSYSGWYNILVPIFELIVWGKCTVKTVGLFDRAVGFLMNGRPCRYIL